MDDISEVTYLRDAFDTYNEKLPQIAREYLSNLKETMLRAFKQAEQSRDYAMSKAKLIYDRKAYPDFYSEGDLVLASHPAIVSGQTRGLAKKAHGPFRVLARINQVDYLLQKADQTNGKRIILHQNNLRKYFGTVKTTVDGDIKLKLEPKARRRYTKRVVQAEQVAQQPVESSREDAIESSERGGEPTGTHH